MPSGAAERLFVIDGHSLIFQVFHAIREPMTSPDGLPTNALFGFLRDLLFLRQRQPDYLLCAFDRGEPTFRSAIHKDYKAHRPPPPSDLDLQLDRMHRVPETLGIPVLSVAGFEADDVMATVARAASARGIDVFLCTADKDCRQLLDGHVRLYNLRKRQEFGPKELLADWGVRPDQVVDFQTLVGDAVDNVQGVAGIGEKTAAKLLQEFDTLENLLQHIDKVPGAKKQEALRAAVPTLPNTRQLVRLRDDVPLDFDWEGWRLGPLDNARVAALCREWGFRTLEAQFRAGTPAAVSVPMPVGGGEDFLFGANVPEAESSPEVRAPAAPWQKNYLLIDSPGRFEEFLDELKQQKRIAFDLETTSLQPLLAEPVGYAFSWKEGTAYYVAVRAPLGMAHLDSAETLRRLREVFENPGIAKVNQNVKYDLLVLRAHGVTVRGVVGDPMVADYLLHAGERSHNLEELARRYLNHQVIPITDLIGKKGRKQAQLGMDQVPTDRVAEYAGEDADVALRLAGLLERRLEEEGGGEEEGGETPPLPTAADRGEVSSPSAPGARPMRKLYDDLEVPLIDVLAELEFNGVRVDVPRLRRLGDEMGRQLMQIENEIYDLAGKKFNIGSLVQLRQVLFDELKLPPQRRTGVTGAASTDQETLERLAALDHPNARLPRKILEQRRIAKLKSTYVDALPELVNPRTGRVHTSFNQTVTTTGRLSSSDPNLQNIPVRREEGREVRQAFVPAEGWLLLTADYSQIELRLLAHFAGDNALLQAFVEDRDVHTAVAGEIFHVAQKEVTSEQRRVAKTVNFGVLYGMSATGLAQRLNIPRPQAERFIDAYFARYPKVLEYQARLLSACRRSGYVGTILGRRRRFDTSAIRAGSTYQQRNQAEREAINLEIQGSAADLIKLAMLSLHRRLKEDGRRARLLLQIHDELVFETPPDGLKELAELVRHEMTTPLAKRLGLRVPLRVDLAAGPNWLDVEEIAAA
jgi:DNA polymerase-1